MPVLVLVLVLGLVVLRSVIERMGEPKAIIMASPTANTNHTPIATLLLTLRLPYAYASSQRRLLAVRSLLLPYHPH